MTRMSRWLLVTLLITVRASSLIADESVIASEPPLNSADGSGKPAAAEPVADIAPPEVVATVNSMPLLQPGLESLIQQALANSPRVQRVLADVQKAKGLRYQSTRPPNPTAGYTASEIGNDGQGGQQGVFWSQTFRVAEKLNLNNQIGHFDVQATTWNWQVEQARTTGAVKLAWYAAAAAQQRVSLLDKLETVLEGGVRTTRSLLKAGEIGRGPHLQAKLELQRILLEIRNAESAFEAAKRQLAATAATRTDLLPAEFPGLNDSLGFADEDSYLADIVANSPQLQLARARVAQTQTNVCRQQVEPKPDLQTQFSVQHDDATNYTVSGVQLGVRLPLFDRNRGNISAASAEHIRACQEVRRLELELTRKAAGAYRDLTIANRDLSTIDSELLPLAQDNLRATSESFKLGESNYQNLLTAQRSFVELIVSRIDALRRARQTEAVIDSYLLAEE